MPRMRIAATAITVFASLLAAHAVRAEPAPTALIVGTATYSTLPVIPGCARSANAVSAALRNLGFEIIDRQDASTGGIDAGITDFSQRMAGGKSAGFVYICGYATDFNDRTFLLPTTARIARPTDVLTQGVLAKSMLAMLSRDPATIGVVVFDLVAKPDGPVKIDIDALTALPVADGVGVVAASETTLSDSPTPLAAAVVAALAGPRVSTEMLVTAVQTQLSGNKSLTAAAHMPVRGGFLAGAPPVVEAKPPPAPVGAVPVTPSGPETVTLLVTLPDEARMTESDRRKVQSALVRLGYYAHPIDGVFGAETRAAIRRYQHEIGGETTGRLTGEQASRLVSSR